MPNAPQSNCVHSIPRAERIARLNDILRKTGTSGQIVITRGVHDLAKFNAAELLAALGACNDFDPTNDPHGERDFGGVDLWGAEILWKIDYYDAELRFGSGDPADASMTQRVLTVLLAEEY